MPKNNKFLYIQYIQSQSQCYLEPMGALSWRWAIEHPKATHERDDLGMGYFFNFAHKIVQSGVLFILFGKVNWLLMCRG